MSTFGWSFKAPDRTAAASATLASLTSSLKRKPGQQDDGSSDEDEGYAAAKQAALDLEGAKESSLDKKLDAAALQSKLFVGHLKKNVEPEKLRDFFSVFGEVEEAIVIKNAAGISRGFGFVTFEDQEDALRAIAWCNTNEAKIHGKAIEVNMATRRTQALRDKDHEARVAKEKERDRTKVGLLWQYKWDNTNPQAEVFGPFRSDDMRAWIRDGYFKVAPVYVRIFQDDKSEFVHIDEVDFDEVP